MSELSLLLRMSGLKCACLELDERDSVSDQVSDYVADMQDVWLESCYCCAGLFWYLINMYDWGDS